MLATHAGMLAWTAAAHSPTVDEPHHLIGGLVHLCTGRSSADPGNPPLAGTVAAAPVLFAGGATRVNESGTSGADFFAIIKMGRFALIPFSVFGGIICFRWASVLYGQSAGVIATALWSFCPSTLATGHLINGDMAATACGVAAYYEFWIWLQRPSTARAFIAGSLLGLAEVSKYVWIVNYVAWPAIILLATLAKPRLPVTHGRLRFGDLAAGFAAAILVIHLFYGFDDLIPGRATAVHDDSLAGVTGPSVRESGCGRLMARVLPSDYCAGICEVRSFIEHTRPQSSYLFGGTQAGGFLFYYPIALLIKLPLGLIALFAISIARWSREVCASRFYTGAMLLGVIASLLCFVTLATGSQQMVRYVLPALPFMIIVASGAICGATLPVYKFIAIALVFWSTISGIREFPHSAAYCNELVGGPARGSECLSGSDIDSGQNLLFLAKWQDKHPEANPLHLAFAGPGHVSWAGIRNPTPVLWPLGDGSFEIKPGWYAVSTSFIYGDSPLKYFRQLRPVDVIGYTVNIYYIATRDVYPAVGPADQSTTSNCENVDLLRTM